MRPCDAASVFPLDAVFKLGLSGQTVQYPPGSAPAIVSVSCAKADGACFCTAVGGGPGSTAGSDILLTYTPEGAIAEVSTEKGERLVALSQALFEPSDGKDKEKYLAALPAAFDREQLRARLEGMFDSPVWKQQSERCLGCGACAYVCPTCSCFDIQDRSAGQTGQRLRCWDSCGFALFTHHTSGHNPRPTQATRWRQRLLHKFSYMPQRLKALGCTGCGRCSRACPVDMNLKDHLVSIADTK